MDKDHLYNQPMDDAFMKALLSPNEKDWYKYRLGDESPSFGELLGITATGRFKGAREERAHARQALMQMQMNAEKERATTQPLGSFVGQTLRPPVPTLGLAPGAMGQQLDVGPLVLGAPKTALDTRFPTNAQLQENITSFKQRNPSVPYTSASEGVLNERLANPLGQNADLMGRYPQAPTMPPSPLKPVMSAPGPSSYTFAGRPSTESVYNALKGSPLPVNAAALDNLIQRFAPEAPKITPTDTAKMAVLQRAVQDGNWDEVRRIADTLEKEKADKDEVAKFTASLEKAKILPGTPEWTEKWKEYVAKQAMHPPAAQQQMIVKQESAESAKVGAGFGEDFVTMQRAATSANTKLAKLDRMQFLMEGVTTGKLIPTMTELESLGKTLGFTVNPTLPAKQALTALSNEIALEMRSTGEGNGMPGALSDKDREFLVAMTPNLSTTPEGNRLLIETRKTLLKREQKVAQLAREYRKKNGHLDEGFYDELQAFADANPLFQSAGKPWEKYKGK